MTRAEAALNAFFPEDVDGAVFEDLSALNCFASCFLRASIDLIVSS